MLTGWQILVCWIGRVVQWTFTSWFGSKKLLLGNCALICIHGRAIFFLASSCSASWPGVWLKSEFDKLIVMSSLRSDNFYWIFFSFFFWPFLFTPFWSAIILDCFLPEEARNENLVYLYVAPVYPAYFYSPKAFSNWPVHFKSNVLHELFLKISEESVILRPN